jgi:hypothetical protein
MFSVFYVMSQARDHLCITAAVVVVMSGWFVLQDDIMRSDMPAGRACTFRRNLNKHVHGHRVRRSKFHCSTCGSMYPLFSAMIASGLGATTRYTYDDLNYLLNEGHLTLDRLKACLQVDDETMDGIEIVQRDYLCWLRLELKLARGITTMVAIELVC